jgi:branched-chain amino acid transport system substrate-binding protein
MRHPWKAGIALLLALSLTGAACGGRDDDSSDGGTTDDGTEAPAESAGFINPDEDCENYEGTKGVEGNTIKIGTIRPESGNYAIYDLVTQGLEAYFKAMNEEGGLEAGDGEKYQVELIKKNDEYDPAKTPALAKQLVEQDGVFAMVGNIGTETNEAIRDYMNDNCVPNIGLATGSTQWGTEANAYPWYISALPSYAAEANAWIEYLKAEAPQAKIALLYQDDDFGEGYKGAIEKAIEGTEITVVAEQSFNPRSGGTTEAAVTQMSASGADVFVVGIGGSPCPVTLSFMPDNWDPMTFISVTCASKTALALAQGKDQGVFLAQPTLDAADPADAENPKIVEFKRLAQVGGLSTDQIEGGISSPGWGFGAFFAEGLRNAETVDRAAVMNALYSLEDANFGILRDEVTVNTDGAEDPWAIEGFRIVQREGEGWTEKTPVTNFEGQSNDFAG